MINGPILNCTRRHRSFWEGNNQTENFPAISFISLTAVCNLVQRYTSRTHWNNQENQQPGLYKKCSTFAAAIEKHEFTNESEVYSSRNFRQGFSHTQTKVDPTPQMCIKMWRVWNWRLTIEYDASVIWLQWVICDEHSWPCICLCIRRCRASREPQGSTFDNS